jgi:hypothetical protein
MVEKKEELKREYEKPRLRIIELAAEEVMGIGCKRDPTDTSGVANQGCAIPACSTTPGS